MKRLLKALGIALLALTTLSTSAVYGPRIHYDLLRAYAARKVVYVTDAQGQRGGTGFYVKAPSGKSYILTNAHVCALQQEGEVWISSDRKRLTKRRIIESSVNTDLCLIEPLTAEQGLTVSSYNYIGEILAAVGHPNLDNTTMTRGEVAYYDVIKVFDYIINNKKDEERCSMPKNRIEKVMADFGLFMAEVKACLISIDSTATTIPIMPGSSGSPVINIWGHLSGVVFAINRSGWAMLVSLTEIKTFLSAY